MRIRVVEVNKIKLMYLRWKNKKEINLTLLDKQKYNIKENNINMALLDKKKYNTKENNINMALLDVFYSIKPTNTYPGWLHNNLKLYRALQYNPENKIIKRMFMDGHLRLFSMKSTWKFAKQIYKQERA